MLSYLGFYYYYSLIQTEEKGGKPHTKKTFSLHNWRCKTQGECSFQFSMAKLPPNVIPSKYFPAFSLSDLSITLSVLPGLPWQWVFLYIQAWRSHDQIDQ